MNYKTHIPEIANRVKYCVTQESLIEFVKSELENAYQQGFQDGYIQGRMDQMDGEINRLDERISEHEQALKPIPDLGPDVYADRPPIAGDERVHPIFKNILAATRMGRV